MHDHDELDYLYSLQKFGIKFGLSATAELLQRLGNPQSGRRCVHIAGTNRKGSVAVFLASILQQAGYTVGLYTSPHLVRFRERFQINFQEIDREQVLRLARKVRRVIQEQEPPTFFEAVTAMALVYFAEADTDLDIIETGMGGRLDATNLVQPLITVITNVSLEHQAYLGTSLEAITREKAGVIKSGVPVVSGATQTKARQILQAAAAEHKAPLYFAGRDFRSRKTKTGLHYFGLNQRLNRLRLGLPGAHQAQNASLALAGMELLADQGISTDAASWRRGLEQARWPGRMHLLPGPPRILLDGAHNAAAVKSLSRALQQEWTFSRLLLVIGIMADKDAQAMLGALLPLADRVIFTRPVYERAMDPLRLQALGRAWAVPGEVIQPLERALEAARHWAGADDLIVVTGSLFTVGEALSCLDPVRYAPD